MIKLEEGIGDKVSALLYNTAVSISCIVMTLMRGWKLALVCLSTAPITFLLVGLTGAVNMYHDLLDLAKKNIIMSNKIIIMTIVI